MKRLKCFLMYFSPLMLLFFFSFTCGDKVEGGHQHISFVNNSEDTIYVSEKGQMKILPEDTLYNKGSISFEILPHDTCLLSPLNNYWETDFRVRDFVMYFVLSVRPSTFKTSEEARMYQLKRYQLTREDLERQNWIVTYP